jgi:3-hydroxyisobutyrate dehydrogenase-like beta-hydroxyacid dehydrogenase
VWASAGRSAKTRERAQAAGLEDAGSVARLVQLSDVIISVCPPHAAREVARSVAGFEGVFVDANAISPVTARELSEVVASRGGEFVDGGIVGSPPRTAGTTRLYLSGTASAGVVDLFAGSAVDVLVVSDEVGAASAVKMAYAAWTKGTAALLIAIRELARAEEVEPILLEEWRASLPELLEWSERAVRSGQTKGWRWVGEMEEIAATFSASGLPGGFHQAAAEVFRTFTVEPSQR